MDAWNAMKIIPFVYYAIMEDLLVMMHAHALIFKKLFLMEIVLNNLLKHFLMIYHQKVLKI